MSSVVLSGDTSGTVTLTVPAVAGTNTVTVPAQTGTMMVNGPAFSVYRGSSNQNITGSTWTKVQLNAATFDTNNSFDITTNYRFTPTVAGYYQISASIGLDSTNYTQGGNTAIYKNGAVYAQTGFTNNSATLNTVFQPISALIYMNGSTDYLELWGIIYQGSGTVYFDQNSKWTYMTGSLVRGA